MREQRVFFACPMVGQARMGDHKSQSLAGQVGYALEGGFMNTNDIILTIDAEISRLQQAKALLTDTFSLTLPHPRKAQTRAPGHYIWGRQSNQL
jgi:hypothetical protein